MSLPKYRELMSGEKQYEKAKTWLHCLFTPFSKDLSPRKLAQSQGKKDVTAEQCGA